ncbi:MAG: hypothetical protein AAFV80_16920, partial [Bacteroidota bacterium]
EPNREHLQEMHRILIKHDIEVFEAYRKKNNAYKEGLRNAVETLEPDLKAEAKANKLKDERDELKQELDTLKILLNLMDKLPKTAKSDIPRRGA